MDLVPDRVHGPINRVHSFSAIRLAADVLKWHKKEFHWWKETKYSNPIIIGRARFGHLLNLLPMSASDRINVNHVVRAQVKRDAHTFPIRRLFLLFKKQKKKIKETEWRESRVVNEQISSTASFVDSLTQKLNTSLHVLIMWITESLSCT